MKKIFLLILCSLFVNKIFADFKTIGKRDVPDNNFFTMKNVFFFEFFDEKTDDDILFHIRNSFRTTKEFKAQLYAYYDKQEQSAKKKKSIPNGWMLAGEVDFPQGKTEHIDGYIYQRDDRYHDKYKYTRYYALVPLDEQMTCRCSVYQKDEDMYIIIDTFHCPAINGFDTFLGSWEYKDNTSKVEINFYPDNTYTIEKENDIVSMGYYVTKLKKLANHREYIQNSDKIIFFSFFSSNNGKLIKKINEEVFYATISFDEKKLTVEKFSSDSKEDFFYHTYEFIGSNYKISEESEEKIFLNYGDLNNITITFEKEKANFLTNPKLEIFETYRKAVIEEFDDRYYVYDKKYFKKTSLPRNITSITTISYKDSGFLYNNPYNYDKQTLYVVVGGGVFQWLNADSCLFDFTNGNYVQYPIKNPYAYVYNMQGAFAPAYLIYEGTFQYTTATGSINIVPKFMRVTNIKCEQL